MRTEEMNKDIWWNERVRHRKRRNWVNM